MARARRFPRARVRLTDVVGTTDVARSCDRSVALHGRQVVFHDKPTMIA